MIHHRALELIESFEGYHRRLPDGRAAPYLCPARVATIGVGSTFYEDGRRVALSDPPIARERAHELLAHELRQCEAAVDRLVTRRLSALARGALVSFAYNCGAGALRSSTLLRKVNAGDDAGASREFAKWSLAGGVRLRGLERRRAAEAAMYLDGQRGKGDATVARDADGVGAGPVRDAGGGLSRAPDRPQRHGGAAAGGFGAWLTTWTRGRDSAVAGVAPSRSRGRAGPGQQPPAGR